MSVRFHPMDQGFVDRVRAGGPDANGQPAELSQSNGTGNQCRSCLTDIPNGAQMLVLAARPFPRPQPYAEVGPVFLCAEACKAFEGEGIPPILSTSPDFLLKGYGSDDRIVYGTGRIVASEDVESYASEVLNDARVAYVDVRSARNNCYQTRITKA